MRTKSIVLLGAILVLTANVSAVPIAPVKLNSSITEVTVYPNQAKIVRQGVLHLEEGDHILVFENIPMSSDAASFHAVAYGESRPKILGLSHTMNEHFESPEKKVAKLEAELDEIINGRKTFVDYRLAVLEDKKAFLLALKEQSESDMTEEVKHGDIDVVGWRDAYNFFGDNMGVLSDSLRQLRLWSTTLSDTIEIMQRKIQSVKSYRGGSTREVRVDIRMETAGEITLALDYTVGGASWRPIYDARLSLDGEKVTLECFAEILQKTGEDWDGVNLTVSTAEPSRAAGPGILRPWYIAGNYENLRQVAYLTASDAETPPDLAKVIRVTAEKRGIDKRVSNSKVTISRKDIENNRGGEIIIRGGVAGEVAYEVDEPIGNPSGGYGLVDFGLSKVGSSLVATTYKTSRKENINSGSDAARVPLIGWNLDAEMSLICRPRLNKEAYRLVEITNQNEAPLLPGQVSIFANTEYIGKAVLAESIAPGQTFEIPFGSEKGIEVNRKLIVNKRTVKGDKIRLSQTYEIKLKNWNLLYDRNIKLEEAFPVSQDSRVKVKSSDIEPEPDNLNEEGLATWNLKLAPHEERKLTFTFEIIYPKGARVSGI